MRFVSNQKTLLERFTIANMAVADRPTHPVLGTIKITADKKCQTITFFANNLEVGVSTTFDAQVEESGKILVSAKLLGALFTKLPSGETLIDNDRSPNEIVVSFTGGSAKLPAMTDQEFPEVFYPSDVNGKNFFLVSDSFLTGISRTYPIASDDETKQILCGVFLSIQGNQVEFAATNGHHLSVFKIDNDPDVKIEDDADDTFTAVIPSSTLQKIEKLIAKSGRGAFQITLENNQVFFDLGSIQFSSRILEGTYPNYPALIPTQFNHSATVDRKALIESLDRLTIFSSPRMQRVKCSFEPGISDNLSIEMQSGDSGQGEENIFLSSYSGEDITIGFNIRYLLEGLRLITGSDVVFNIVDARKIVILNSPDSDINHVYGIMPVVTRIGENE